MRAPPGDAVEEGAAGSNEGRVGLLLVLALATLVSVARGVTRSLAPAMMGGNHRRGAGSVDGSLDGDARTRPYAPTSLPLPRRGRTGSGRNATVPMGGGGGGLLQSSSSAALPIYLLDTSNNRTAQTTWDHLTTSWNRTTQYADLLAAADAVPSLPLPSDASSTRTVVMIHCGPKTGSTTLRAACRRNLEKTCGINHRGVKNHAPVGYMDEESLYPLMRQCTNTSHFCAKEISMPYDVAPFDDVFFVHTFPFRNYDEWAASALKQAYDRGREKGCEKAQALLEECTPSRMEIDFRKYGKAELSKFKEGVVQRMMEKGERHAFVLYHHRELDDVLKRLSEVYQIPTLPGSSGHGKEVRPKGTCDAGLLQLFHDCFSSQLMELT